MLLSLIKVLQQATVVPLDECTMSHKKSLEAVDRIMKDLCGNQRLFGGALILLSGDVRQTLPEIARSTPADEIYGCFLWRYVQKLT